MELNNKKEFALAVLDENAETFMIHVATLSATLAIKFYPFCQI